MSDVPSVRRIPLWLIFAGLLAIPLAVMTLVHHSEVYETSMPGKRCMVEIKQVGAPVLYVTTSDSCHGETTDWRWGAIAAAGGIALTVASLMTNIVAGRRRGVSGRQQWLAALIIVLALGGLTAFSGGLGSSIDCHSPEGLCAWPLLIFGGSGAVAAVIGVGATIAAWKNISSPIRAVGLGAIPAMLALFMVAAVR